MKRTPRPVLTVTSPGPLTLQTQQVPLFNLGTKADSCGLAPSYNTIFEALSHFLLRFPQSHAVPSHPPQLPTLIGSHL